MHGARVARLQALGKLRQQRGPPAGEVVAGHHGQGLAELRARQRGRRQHEPREQALDLLLHTWRRHMSPLQDHS